ncbi:hypothetical protein RRU94_16050 [Domibacillus sp. DTU_2020_1001157_1_SI_ALB_TIR_016]|uniref:hypothetical protein n=1 Tax=Domibacillus sp. DTU_2020_1001157_1_SI_ALB_TIR_016 TaxID=3077789 RepID=UPI0028E802AE|nr:hypothetical protein [Domibacillus sp. DTU_2020_1001157_1_SI_ALB_TIR_016]WNS82249.1 hypothetical protein RRU94_16050 [Domibacillus sp. DTU_2020_1001157_1_SI_ALB_TIR_016]
MSPSGDFIIADYCSIEIIKSTLINKIQVDSPVEMDMIKFHGWSNNKLLITGDGFLNGNHVELELDGGTFEITVKD